MGRLKDKLKSQNAQPDVTKPDVPRIPQSEPIAGSKKPDSISKQVTRQVPVQIPPDARRSDDTNMLIQSAQELASGKPAPGPENLSLTQEIEALESLVAETKTQQEADAAEDDVLRDLSTNRTPEGSVSPTVLDARLAPLKRKLEKLESALSEGVAEQVMLNDDFNEALDMEFDEKIKQKVEAGEIPSKDYVDQRTNEVLKKVGEQGAAVKQAFDGLKTQTTSLIEGLKTQISQINIPQSLSPSDVQKMIDAAVTEVGTSLDGKISQLAQKPSLTMKEVETFVQRVMDNLLENLNGQLNEKISPMSKNVTELSDTMTKLIDAVNKLQANVQTINLHLFGDKTEQNPGLVATVEELEVASESYFEALEDVAGPPVQTPEGKIVFQGSKACAERRLTDAVSVLVPALQESNFRQAVAEIKAVHGDPEINKLLKSFIDDPESLYQGIAEQYGKKPKDFNDPKNAQFRERVVTEAAPQILERVKLLLRGGG